MNQMLYCSSWYFFSKLICYFRAISIKISDVFAGPEMHIKGQGSEIQIHLDKNNKSWETHKFSFQNCNPVLIKRCLQSLWQKHITVRWNSMSRNQPYINGQLIFNIGGKIIQCKRNVFNDMLGHLSRHAKQRRSFHSVLHSK